jgi:hypothetical protein
MCSNIPAEPAYLAYLSQLIRYSRACGSYHDLLDRELLLTKKLLNQHYLNCDVAQINLWIRLSCSCGILDFKFSEIYAINKYRQQTLNYSVKAHRLYDLKDRKSWYFFPKIEQREWTSFLSSVFIFNNISLLFHPFFYYLTCSCPYIHAILWYQ